MKAKKTLFGFAALFLAAVFSLTCLACKNEEEDDSGGGSSVVVAKWYETQALADAQGMAKVEFKSDGTYEIDGVKGMPTYSVSGSTITYKMNGTDVGTAAFAINGTKLTISNRTAGPNDGDYYKKQ